MNVKQIRDLSSNELNQNLDLLKKELFDLRFKQAVGQLENPMRIRDIRKTIARIKTILTERVNKEV